MTKPDPCFGTHCFSLPPGSKAFIKMKNFTLGVMAGFMSVMSSCETGTKPEPAPEAQTMSEIIETADHPFWGKIQRREGYGNWDFETAEKWPDQGLVKIRVSFDDPDDPVVQSNYKKMREKWQSLWERIVKRTEVMKAHYGYQAAPIDPESDWLDITPPKISIEEGPEWSVLLQTEEAGWLMDFKGWEDAGGQGVF